jgi:hypothetical protein|tara:strand:+ start:179 stop:508 length:330 start_codon:yes stop_codon:yes gene_type:complete
MKLNSDVSIESLYDLTSKDSNKSLYAAVVIQALLDVSKPEFKKENNNIKLQRDQAHAWFFTSVGVTCEDFETICYYAGLEPQKVRSFAYKVINEKDVENVRRKLSSLIY